MKRLFILFFLGVFASICPPMAARAGATGSIAGHVVDALTGAPIAGAAIDIASPADARKTITDGNGYYVALCLTPSTYTVTVGRIGYVTVATAGVIVVPDKQSVANVHLPKRQFTVLLIDRASYALVQPAKTADVYVLTPWNVTYFDNPAMRMHLLDAVPGVQTAGEGARPQ